MYPRQMYFMANVSFRPLVARTPPNSTGPRKFCSSILSMDAIRERLEAIYHEESGRILATLIRLLGDFDLAEDAMHEAFSAALSAWPREGVPASPRAWLVSAGRF